MKILIAGGGGLVGQDLTVLLAKKNKIISLYRSKIKIKIKNKNKNIKWKMVDLKKKISLKEKPDIIVNCVAAHKFSKKHKIDGLDLEWSEFISPQMITYLKDLGFELAVWSYSNEDTMATYLDCKRLKIT